MYQQITNHSCGQAIACRTLQSLCEKKGKYLMAITALILTIANIIIIVVALLLMKNYLPSYITEKAKNLATKEDIELITDKVEGVKSQYIADIEKLKTTLSEGSKLLERRRKIYEDIACSLRIFLSGNKTGPEEREHFLNSYATAWLWAPDSVISSLNLFLDLQIRHASSPGSVEQDSMRDAYATIVLEMRKDVGFSTTEMLRENYKFVHF